MAVQGSVNKSQVGVGGIAPSTGLFTSADKFDAIIRGVGARHEFSPYATFGSQPGDCVGAVSAQLAACSGSVEVYPGF
jgi:hypothetical protein